MKNLLVYYFLIITPFALIIYSAKNNLISNTLVVILFFFYLLIYRTIIDYYRLRNKNAIEKNQFLNLLIPFSRMKYFRALYWI